ncbi:hypothetical protein [Cecembia rubra]|uniref:N-acetyltransferase domain-containing protein n=1 Tax=Cecembia rubra TaxID=1485585 RepID=A0A2P8E4C8_9BACT|nr:hypothetical protein [Cecembia rubra]PSL04321.1 hypothetical protein CLV48_10562 [Cecembia rubra]
MKIKEVLNAADEQDFIQVHVQINSPFPNWIRPLDKDVLEVFDPARNKQLKPGTFARWILFDGKGHLIGRIAAFVNSKYRNKGDKFQVGGIGFFDCTNDQLAADLLFNTAKEWLMARGMEAMDGPINYGDRDKWWGLLVEGFEPPIYSMNYNPPYYQHLFENYGFKVFYNQICWSMQVAQDAHQLSPKFYESHQKFEGNPDFKVVHLNKKQLQKFAGDLATVYNKAWAKHEGNKEITQTHAYKLLKSMLPVLDEKLIWFVFHKDEPVVMWINLPDINQIIKHLDGNLNWWGKLKFVFWKTFGKNESFVGLVFGIVPEFQGTGLDYYMIVEAEKEIKATRSYKKLELYWQGDFNPKMLNISKNLGAKQYRKMVTYRYIFDRNIPFERHPILN